MIFNKMTVCPAYLVMGFYGKLFRFTKHNKDKMLILVHRKINVVIFMASFIEIHLQVTELWAKSYYFWIAPRLYKMWVFLYVSHNFVT